MTLAYMCVLRACLHISLDDDMAMFMMCRYTCVLWGAAARWQSLQAPAPRWVRPRAAPAHQDMCTQGHTGRASCLRGLCMRLRHWWPLPSHAPQARIPWVWPRMSAHPRARLLLLPPAVGSARTIPHATSHSQRLGPGVGWYIWACMYCGSSTSVCQGARCNPGAWSICTHKTYMLV